MCAGFGIRSHEQVEQLKGHVAGVIVGSALVEVLESGQDAGRVPEIPAPGLADACNTSFPVTRCSPCCIGGLSMVSPFSIDTFFPAFHAMEKALHVDAWQLQQVHHGVHGAVRIRLAGARAVVGCRSAAAR